MNKRKPFARENSALDVKHVHVQEREEPQEMEEVPRKSLDVGELFSKGFGAVRRGTMQELR